MARDDMVSGGLMATPNRLAESRFVRRAKLEVVEGPASGTPNVPPSGTPSTPPVVIAPVVTPPVSAEVHELDRAA
ncbi:MAG: hypothetical protein ABI877_19865 [Gemmatimonadaceae bacterium]